MTTPVSGPNDVKPGDLVEVRIHYNRNGRSGIAAVVKATADKLTVRWPDGKSSTLAYSHTYRAQTWDRKICTHRNFSRLDAHDRWLHARPTTPDVSYASITVDENGRRSSIGRNISGSAATNAAVRDRPDDVIAQIRALSEWLKAEPSKEEP